jgi:hypothetical protein
VVNSTTYRATECVEPRHFTCTLRQVRARSTSHTHEARIALNCSESAECNSAGCSLASPLSHVHQLCKLDDFSHFHRSSHLIRSHATLLVHECTIPCWTERRSTFTVRDSVRSTRSRLFSSDAANRQLTRLHALVHQRNPSATEWACCYIPRLCAHTVTLASLCCLCVPCKSHRREIPGPTRSVAFTSTMTQSCSDSSASSSSSPELAGPAWTRIRQLNELMDRLRTPPTAIHPGARRTRTAPLRRWMTTHLLAPLTGRPGTDHCDLSQLGFIARE